MTTKRTCDYRCGWHGHAEELIAARLVIIATGEEIDHVHLLCPRCLESGDIVTACDEPDCWEEATQGTPTPDGYRTTCYRHAPGRNS